MYQAGCRQIHYGIESGNEEVLRRTAKHIDLQQVRDAVRWTEQAGIRSKGYFILGLPGDTEETMQETIEFAAGLELTEAMFSIATPFPGTKLWNELVAKNPGMEFNSDFTKSYYYNNYTAEIAPFMNVSEVGDGAAERHGPGCARALPGGQGAAQVRQVLWPAPGASTCTRCPRSSRSTPPPRSCWTAACSRSSAKRSRARARGRGRER